MKHLKLLLLISLLLCGCSSNEVAGDNVTPTPTIMLTATPTPTIEPTVPPVSENTSSDSYAEDEHIQEIIANAEKLAASSKKITEGTLYDSIASVHPDVSITDMGASLSVSIKLSHESPEVDTIRFFSIITSIMEQCCIENDYSGIAFSMSVDGGSVCMVTLTNYVSPSSFSSSNPIVFSEEYEAIVIETYTSLFVSSDIANNFDTKLDELRKKYSVSN